MRKRKVVSIALIVVGVVFLVVALRVVPMVLCPPGDDARPDAKQRDREGAYMTMTKTEFAQAIGSGGLSRHKDELLKLCRIAPLLLGQQAVHVLACFD